MKGVAGSGKTAVLVHRIHRLLNDRPLTPPRILVVSYTNMLVDHAEELASAIGVSRGTIEVTTLHAMCRRLSGWSGTILKDHQQDDLISNACGVIRARSLASRIWDHPPKFWRDEFHLIKGRLIRSREEYLRMERIGAGRGLNEDLRALVWEAFTQYQHLKELQRARDWDDLVLETHDRLRAPGGRRRAFDFVFVDEAQDLTPAGIKVLSLLSEPQTNLFVAFDPAQSIFERGFRWKDCGVQVHPGRSFALRRNYRNTIEILDAARGLLPEPGRTATDDGAEHLLAPEPVARRGASPTFLVDSDRNLYKSLASDIEQLISESKPPVPPGNVAVLCFPNREAAKIAAALRDRHINTQCQDEGAIRIGDPSVKVLHLKSAKGLEFPVVYLVASGSLFQSRSSDESERQTWIEELRRTFYMGITRAMSRLTIVHAKGDPPPFAFGPTGAHSVRYLLVMGEDAVLDRRQALLWQGQARGPMTYRDAMRYAGARASAGWRLPTKEELQELHRSMDPGTFPEVRDWFWASETPDLEFAWAVSFVNGEARDWLRTNTFRVRCVRSESASDAKSGSTPAPGEPAQGL